MARTVECVVVSWRRTQSATLPASPWRRRCTLALLGAGGAAVLSGCGGVGFSGAQGAAQVRFVEVSPSGPAMDFYVNGTGAAFNLSYESYTSYLPVTPGATTLSAHRTGAAQSLVELEGELQAGHQYTAVLSHGLGSLHEHLFADQETAAPAGEIALRVVNATEGSAPMQLYIEPVGSGTPPAVSSLTLGSGAASGYVNLPAGGAYTVIATEPQGLLHVPVGSAVTVKALSGAVRTVVFAGTVNTTGHGNVVGFVLNDMDPQ